MRGSGGDKGDIALDDVSIKNGRCPNPGRLFIILSDEITGDGILDKLSVTVFEFKVI